METAVKPTGESGLTTKEKIIFSAEAALLVGMLGFMIWRGIRKHREKKEQDKSLEEGTTATYAKQIKMAFDNDGYWGTNLAELRRVLIEIPSKELVQKTATSYYKLYKRNMFKDMESELKSSEYNEMLGIVAAKPDKAGGKTALNYEAWAKRLKAAFDKTYGFMPGTDEEAINAVFLEIPTQQDFIEVGKAYNRKYGGNLLTDLKGELEIWEIDEYMKIILSKPK